MPEDSECREDSFGGWGWPGRLMSNSSFYGQARNVVKQIPSSRIRGTTPCTSPPHIPSPSMPSRTSLSFSLPLYHYQLRPGIATFCHAALRFHGREKPPRTWPEAVVETELMNCSQSVSMNLNRVTLYLNE